MTYTYAFVAERDINLIKLDDPKDALLDILRELRTDFVGLCENDTVHKLDDFITSLSKITFDDFFNQYNVNDKWSLQLDIESDHDDDYNDDYELVVTRCDNSFFIYVWSNLDDDCRWDAVLKHDPTIPTHI